MKYAKIKSGKSFDQLEVLQILDKLAEFERASFRDNFEKSVLEYLQYEGEDGEDQARYDAKVLADFYHRTGSVVKTFQEYINVPEFEKAIAFAVWKVIK